MADICQGSESGKAEEDVGETAMDRRKTPSPFGVNAQAESQARVEESDSQVGCVGDQSKWTTTKRITRKLERVQPRRRPSRHPSNRPTTASKMRPRERTPGKKSRPFPTRAGDSERVV